MDYLVGIDLDALQLNKPKEDPESLSGSFPEADFVLRHGVKTEVEDTLQEAV